MEEIYKKILEHHGVQCEDVNEIIFAVSDMLSYLAYKFEIEEPYAIDEIRGIRNASLEVRDLVFREMK